MPADSNLSPPVAGRSGPRRPWLLALVGLAGLALVAVGVWLLERAASPDWFAYAPLSDAWYAVPHLSVPGLICVVAGAAVAGGATGFGVASRGRGGPTPAAAR